MVLWNWLTIYQIAQFAVNSANLSWGIEARN
jgi:hypothetical protein